jgi:hypothetical protein
MTLFEYLAIAFSLVLSFAAMRLIGGLPYAVAPDRRYWVHLVFVCSHLFLTILAFWQFWNLRDATWTFPKFVLTLIPPGLIYFTACTLIPEQVSTIESWRSYFYSVRCRFFIGIVLVILAGFVISLAFAPLPFGSPVRIFQLAILLGSLLGAYSSSERISAALAVVYALSLLAMASTAFLQPGAFAV